MLPISFNDIWVKNNVRNIGENEIQLRNYNQLQPVHSTIAKLDIFPLYNYPKIWQDFPNEQIKIIRKTAEFDQKLKNYFLNDLSAVASCNRLLCPACIAGRLGPPSFSVFFCCFWVTAVVTVIQLVSKWSGCCLACSLP